MSDISKLLGPLEISRIAGRLAEQYELQIQERPSTCPLYNSGNCAFGTPCTQDERKYVGECPAYTVVESRVLPPM